MYVNKNFTPREVWKFSGGHVIWLTLWVSLVTLVYKFTGWTWMSIPWLPVSVIGTAVAFYIGFKNNQAYDRLWEARKIWGAIVNSSRAWGSTCKAFVGNQFTETNVSEAEISAVKTRLIYRHIGWLYAMRNQLLIPTTWEHINQNSHVARTIQKRMDVMGIGLLKDLETETNLKHYLPQEEYTDLINFKNTATQIIDYQSQELQKLRASDLIDDFRHMELQKILNDFYGHQGKAERIKKFPLPRQYGFMSFVFVGIFVFILPFGTLGQFDSLGVWGSLLSVPFTILIAWVYIMMELVGDYSENPFEGLGNDIPMLSLCRTIEIDLREMLGEKDLPKPIEPINGILM
jgi:ion channel-forming bestrophin family protein